MIPPTRREEQNLILQAARNSSLKLVMNLSLIAKRCKIQVRTLLLFETLK